MALSDAQKYELMYYLGWPAKVLVEGSPDYSKIMSDRIDNLPTESEAIIGRLLTKLRKIDDKLLEAIDRFSTKRVDDIELNPKERELLKAERNRYIGELSGLTDIPAQKKGGVMFGVCC